jgi:hypothetical protein
MDEIGAFLDELKVSSDDPRFLYRVFTLMSRKLKEAQLDEGESVKRVIEEEYGNLSRRVDKSQFQDSAAIRNVLRARRLATLLINDSGELNTQLLTQVVEHLKQHLYVLGPERQYDGPRNLHLLHVLEKLSSDKTVQRQLKLISRPQGHKIAEQVIRDTLLLPANQALTDVHAQRAALSAWMCFLRQNVGSCFATAPAILVQQEQPELLLKDIQELLGTGRIKRTFGGVEYAVPLSASWGAGDLRKLIAIDLNDQVAVANLSLSPGILQALEATGVINAEKPLRERVEEEKGLVKSMIEENAPSAGFLLVSAEQILSKILMRHHQVSEKDLHDYENRPRTMLHTSLLMAFPVSGSGMGGKGEAAASFLSQFEIAKNAFKAIADNALLKTWEFTMASFAETKPAFTRWNMYASLGFNTDEPGGIAAFLYTIVKEKLDRANSKVQELQGDYEYSFSQLRYIESRMRNASSEKEVQWLRIEYETRRSEYRVLEEMRDREHFKARRFANLLNDLLETYDTLFPRYFQEVYDADMQEMVTGPYDDSPAGFRLLFKHGRANTSQWTLIYTPQEFVSALSSFFIATESELVHAPQFEGLHEEISEIVTQLVTHVKTDFFLESAFQRMAKAHNVPLMKDPLHHLERIEKKPWAYTSGGTMHNLMSCYFRFEGKPTEQKRWVENVMELLVFLVDTVKQMPHKLSEEYLTNKNRHLLMHSPTHAFNLKPSFPLFKDAATNDSYSYTWVRDQWVQPAERFVEYLFLDHEMMQFLLENLTLFVPSNFKPRFQSTFAQFDGKKNPREFRQFLVDIVEQDRGLQSAGQAVLREEQIDSVLWSSLPLSPYQELINRSLTILDTLPGISPEQQGQLSQILEEIVTRWGRAPFATARTLQELCKAALIMCLQATSTAYDYPALISKAAQQLGYALPTPIFFADTNWMRDNFAFLVNPGTSNLELWRMDYIGAEGAPMSMWRPWLNGSNLEPTWGVFTKPFEYKAAV